MMSYYFAGRILVVVHPGALVAERYIPVRRLCCIVFCVLLKLLAQAGTNYSAQGGALQIPYAVSRTHLSHPYNGHRDFMTDKATFKDFFGAIIAHNLPTVLAPIDDNRAA